MTKTQIPTSSEALTLEGDLTSTLDRTSRAELAKLSAGLSSIGIWQAIEDWMLHLAISPGKQLQLAEKALQGAAELNRFIAETALNNGSAEPCVVPSKGDRRFRHEGWTTQPFNVFQQTFLLQQQWWQDATTGVRGVSNHHEQVTSFIAKQVLDAMSPTNFLPTNPEVLAKTWEAKGENLKTGVQNLLRDLAKSGKASEPDPNYLVGKDVAATPGKVVFRNHLIELIQYDAVTDTVKPEPVLIVPAWIMKYYILDLSPSNSMVRYLTEQGYTVFMISWRNPEKNDAELGMADYLEQGPKAALDVIQSITGTYKVHATGYCLGGTLLSIAAAAMARDGDERLASMTLFAAQTDFTEAGELRLFISESALSTLEDLMSDRGFLGSEQMAGAFQLLRSNDLLWSHIVSSYLLGETAVRNDIMAWNADATRMPYKMHSQYLRKLFLDNELAAGKFIVGDKPIALQDIRIPIFAVGTETDHVAPWQSVYKINSLTHAPFIFVLTKGGHNAGILSEPGHPRRHYRVRTSTETDIHTASENWADKATLKEGSWWPEWTGWLAKLSSDNVTPPAMGEALDDAPGQYVKMR